MKQFMKNSPFGAKNSEYFLRMGTGLLAGGTPREQMALASQGLLDARQSAKQAQTKNKTLQFLQNSNPELAQMVEMGALTPNEAVKIDYQQRQGAKVEPTAGMREYDFAKSQGYDGSFMDFQIDRRKAGATQINMPGQPTMGAIPQGFEAIKDPETGTHTMRRIPGGPEDQTASQEAKVAQDAQKAAIASRSIEDIKSKLQTGGMFDLPEAGIVGSRLANMGLNQEAVDVKNALASLQSIVSFDRLQAMREASPTGGALGAVSERELALLQSSMGALSQDSSPKQLIETLNFIQGVMDKFAAYPQGAQATGGSDVDALIDQYAD